MVVNGKSGRNYDTDKKEAETKLRYPLKAGLCFYMIKKLKFFTDQIFGIHQFTWKFQTIFSKRCRVVLIVFNSLACAIR